MRVISFNCDGISQAKEKGALEWLAHQEADIICLQNIKEREDIVEDKYIIDGYNCYAYSSNATNSVGVALYLKTTPKAVIKSFGFSDTCTEGRFIQADFQNISLVSLIIPSVLDGYDRDYKYNFLNNLSTQIAKIRRKRRQFIICGSWDIPHTNMDFTPEALKILQTSSAEKNWIHSLFKKMNFFDAYRSVDQSNNNYSWWHNENYKKNNIGARIDYQVVTDEINKSVLNAGIYKSRSFSNHAPVIVDYDWDLI